MHVATEYYESRGYKVTDTSANHPYDLVATRGSERLFVEVKGTQSAGESVFVTRNEVDHARRHARDSVLFVVHGIKVEGQGEEVQAHGGEVVVEFPWDPADHDLSPVQYEYRRT